MNRFIGIEGGGTKFICAHGTHPNNLQDRHVIKTQSPDITLKEVTLYIQQILSRFEIHAIGIGIFGPLDLDVLSPTYGHITAAAKPGWENVDVVGTIKKICDLPIGFDTDVNSAAMGEYRWGNAQTINDFLYLTVGTGIGGGMMVQGRLLHGAMHPEMGHILIPSTPSDHFPGVCAYHKNCLESLASGTAMNVRWQVPSAFDLPLDHVAWDLEAHYLGIGIANYILTFSPKRIIVGGGIMQQPQLLSKVRQEVLKSVNGYIKCEKWFSNIENYIVKPGLGDNAGICGAIALAEQSLEERNFRRKIELSVTPGVI